MLFLLQINTDWRQSQLPELVHSFPSLPRRHQPSAGLTMTHCWRRPSPTPHITVSITLAKLPGHPRIQDAYAPFFRALQPLLPFADAMDNIQAKISYRESIILIRRGVAA